MLVKTEVNKCLKIIFTKNEAIRIFGNNQPNLRDTHIQKIISNLFIKISHEVNFKTNSKKLYVEIIPAFYGGFLLSFTNLSHTTEEITVVEFDEVNSLLQGIKLIDGEKYIYTFEEKFRIILKADNDKILRISEYCSNIYFSDVEIARTKEYGKFINC